MPTRASFLEFVLESLASLGPVTSRAMFGGHGIYLDGQIFGLVDDDKLFFKADGESRARFESAGGTPFTYPVKKGPMVMAAYWTPPDEVMDSPERLAEWGRRGLEAAARAQAAKKPKKATGGKPAVTKQTLTKQAVTKQAAKKLAAKKLAAKKPKIGSKTAGVAGPGRATTPRSGWRQG